MARIPLPPLYIITRHVNSKCLIWNHPIERSHLKANILLCNFAVWTTAWMQLHDSGVHRRYRPDLWDHTRVSALSSSFPIRRSGATFKSTCDVLFSWDLNYWNRWAVALNQVKGEEKLPECHIGRSAKIQAKRDIRYCLPHCAFCTRMDTRGSSSTRQPNKAKNRRPVRISKQTNLLPKAPSMVVETWRFTAHS